VFIFPGFLIRKIAFNTKLHVRTFLYELSDRYFRF